MTVPSTVSSAIYTSTGATATYNFTWQIARQSDLIVYEINAAGTVATRLTLTTDYTVTGVGVFTGGTIILTAGIPASGIQVFIASDPEQIQQVLLQQGAAFNPADIMHALDLLTREVQANRRLLAGALQFPVAESLDDVSPVVPLVASRANGTLGFDAYGAPVIVGGLSSITISPAMVPVVQAASTAAAFILLGGLPLAGGTMSGAIIMDGFKVTGLGTPTVSSDAATRAYVDAAVSASNAVPVGCSIEFNGPGAIPAGFLEEDGSAVSRTTYADLFTAIGTTFGVGNGTTTFNIPDSRGAVSVGAGTGSGLTPRTLGDAGGEEDHVLTIPEIPSHNHTFVTNNNDSSASGGPRRNTAGSNTNSWPTSYVGGGGGHNTMQPFLVKRKIIRYQI